MPDTARTWRAEGSYTYILIAGIGLGLVLRFIALGGQSLWVDELLTIKNAHIGEPGIISHILQNLQGPAVSLLTHYWGAMGTGEVALRLPFAVAGALTVPAIYFLARLLTDRWTSLHTAFLLALSPIHVWYSQEVRGYAFVVLFSVLSSYFFMKWLKRRGAPSLALYAVCLFAGLVSNLSMVFVAMAHFVYLLLRKRDARVLMWWAVAVCIVLAAFSPWVREIILRVQPQRVVAGDTGAPLVGGADFSIMAVPYAFFTFGTGYTFGPSPRDLQTDRKDSLRRNLPYIALAAVALGIPLAVGLLRAAATDRELLTLTVLWIGVPLLAVTLLAARNIKLFNPRYMLVALPAFALLLGMGAAGLTRTRYALLLLPLLLVLALSLGNYYYDDHYAKDDLRAAARAIEAGYREGDVVAAVFTAEPLEFYLEGVSDVEVFERRDILSPGDMRRRCRGLAAAGDRVWLSLCRDWQVDPDGVIRAWFEQNLHMVDSRAFTGVDLVLYETRGI